MKQYSFRDKEEIKINCYKWDSKGKNIKGVVQIVHGMSEHALRYDFFARKLTEEGYCSMLMIIEGTEKLL